MHYWSVVSYSPPPPPTDPIVFYFETFMRPSFSDIVHCLKKMPPLHICDDPCTFVSHSFIHYPFESLLTLGTERRGCFEPPSDELEPNTGIECTDILPIQLQENESNPAAMQSTCTRDHPDSTNEQRYVTGTRLQTRGKGRKKSHKLQTCQFHNLDHCRQGAEIKSMSQGKEIWTVKFNLMLKSLSESLQNVRKHRTIQTDKLRSFECSYLVNYIGEALSYGF